VDAGISSLCVVTPQQEKKNGKQSKGASPMVLTSSNISISITTTTSTSPSLVSHKTSSYPQPNSPKNSNT